jgi:hypothetical protein
VWESKLCWTRRGYLARTEVNRELEVEVELGPPHALPLRVIGCNSEHGGAVCIDKSGLVE